MVKRILEAPVSVTLRLVADIILHIFQHFCYICHISFTGIGSSCLTLVIQRHFSCQVTFHASHLSFNDTFHARSLFMPHTCHSTTLFMPGHFSCMKFNADMKIEMKIYHKRSRQSTSQNKYPNYENSL